MSGGTLFLVATPIGNHEDIGHRAERCLRDADLIAAEDTRIARTLLGALSIAPRGRLFSLYDSNEAARVDKVLAALADGKDVALISDAGTPLISDPGYLLVRSAIDAGARIDALPGPSAVLTALLLSGLPADRFLFCGFLPRKGSKRRSALQQLADQGATLIFYEAPHRIADTLEDLAATLGERRAALARQLTKPEQTVLRGSLAELHAAVVGQRVHGELSLVVEGCREQARPPSDTVQTLIEGLLEHGLPAREIRDLAHRVFGGDKRELYQRVLDAKGQR